MELFTFSDIKTKLGRDYDIADENFVNDSELAGYVNDAIDDAETTIHTLHHEDKYFFTWETITLISGTQLYSLPSDIYGNKIRMLFYEKGTEKYKIMKLRSIEDIHYIEAGNAYQFLIKNDGTNYTKLAILPTPAEDGTYVTCYYIRNMARVTTSLLSTNVIEIPECINFITQHVRYALARKTRRSDLIKAEKGDLGTQYTLMTDALKDMTADGDNTILPDLSSYEEQEGEINGY